jgi:hypothetical protein
VGRLMTLGPVGRLIVGRLMILGPAGQLRIGQLAILCPMEQWVTFGSMKRLVQLCPVV